MSRSGYTEDCEYLALWRSAVFAALSGERGQMFLRAMLTSLDAMPEKRLIESALVTLDPEDPDDVAARFGIARALAAEIAYENDEGAGWHASETPERRFARMRTWVAANILPRNQR